ncbi:MAG: DMT family transporter [Alphaproteobacteria bacterium]|jgi:drug/metabolite transporter (DMT)-like permease|nr:DMT family transporter [Alphaproteobacteria bacterium]MBT5390281.1 DMT family transporter [Alphaproteobacteria bacterium]MBT5540074.1 DMT family transporter [Alphaproteobacteria bacterium]MBT5654832.1 DMT family transporter [Alphaproteobacteria bacterium]
MRNSISPEHQGAAFAIISGLFYGLLGYFGMTIINANFSISNMLFWRFLVSSITLLLILLPKLKTIRERSGELLKTFVFGGLFYCLAAIIYFISSQYIGTGFAMVLFFTYPAIIILYNGLFCRASINKLYYIALFMIIVGMVLLVDMHEFKFDMVGIGAGVLAAVFYAGYIITSKKISLSPQTSSLMVSLSSALLCLVFAVGENSFSIPTTAYLWFNIIAVGTICTAFPILFLLEGLKRISAEKGSILSVLEPIFVVIFGVILLGEQINIAQTLGVIIILSGALITLLSGSLIIKKRRFKPRKTQT